jgi:hypothetical protein
VAATTSAVVRAVDVDDVWELYDACKACFVMIAMIHASAHSHLCNNDMLLLYPRMPNAHTMISSLRVRRTHYACSQVQLLLLPRLLVVLWLQLWLSVSVVVAGAAVVAVLAVTATAAVLQQLRCHGGSCSCGG